MCKMVALNYFKIIFGGLLQLLQVSHCLKDPTMPGEPLNPLDFENGEKHVMNPDLESDMSINDGTMNDIIEEPAQNPRAKSSVRRWPDATMPYLLDSEFDSTERMMIAKAIQLIHSNTCMRIISRTTESDYVLVRKNLNSTSCSSNVGMIGGKQRLNLAPRCIQRVGSTAHEFMHAMGFHHEQSRTDRDKHVIVHYENILEGRENNFDMRSGEYGNLEGPYDTLSITHYSRSAFSKNGKDTMEPIKGNDELGQRKGLTKYDMDKVNEYYDCEGDYREPMEESKGRKSCKDMNKSDCKLWAYYGYCSKSPMFMTVSCKKTCNKCDMTCVDMNRKCTEWRQKKYCQKHADYMNQYCARSCKQC